MRAIQPTTTLRPTEIRALATAGICLAALAAVPARPAPAAFGAPTRAAGKAISAPAFIQNLGQWDSQAQFLARAPGVDIWITDSGAVYDFHKKNGDRLQGHVVQMEFISSGNTSVEGREPVQGTFNYFKGAQQSKWITGVQRYQEARSAQVYPGIEARWYFDQGSPRYDLIVAPGADPAKVAFRLKGASSLAAQGSSLKIGTSLGSVEQQKLFAYQRSSGGIKQVQSSFRVEGNVVRFDVGTYDRTKPLVIDPVVWASFLGGTAADTFKDFATDTAGNLVIVGDTTSSDFPTVAGSYDLVYNTNTDLFVSRMSSDGSTLQVSSYIGGTGTDTAMGVAIDGSNNVHIAGFTASVNFPVASGYDLSQNGSSDGVVVKMPPTLASLTWSTYYGGTGSDLVYDVAVTATGEVFVAGSTDGTVPLAGSPYDSSTNGSRDGFVVKLSSVCVPTGGTYYGGTQFDQAKGITLDPAGFVVVAGETNSSDIPIVMPSFDPTYSGSDIFIARFNSTLSGLMGSTYLGGTSFEQFNGLDTDTTGGIYICGYTYGSGFPTTAGAFDQTFHGGPRDGFLVSMDAALAIQNYGTYLGGSSDDIAFGVHVDYLDRVNVVGFTQSTDFKTTVGADSASLIGATDMFLVNFQAGLGTVNESTYLGSTGYESAKGVIGIAEKEVLIAGSTYSDTFPVTAGAYDTTYNGLEDTFAMQYHVGNEIASMTVDKASYVGGFGVPITMTLASPAGPTGLRVPVTTDTPGKVLLPFATKFRAGVSTKVFLARTETVKVDTAVTVSATLGGVTKMVSFTLTPGGLLTLKMTPSTMTQLTWGIGYANLSAPAIAGGRNVSLTTNRSDLLYIPQAVTVSEGQTTAGFPTFTLPTASTQVATVTATLGTQQKTDTLTVNP